MSLQIWLPLTKDLRNQGVMSSTITNNGATYNASGKLGGCYSFNGGSSYLMGTQNKISNSTNNWTFSCWMKLNATTAGQCLFSCRTAVTESGISIFYYGSQWLIDDGVRWQFTPTTAIVKDTWYHICIIRQKGIGKFLYVNGTLDKSTTTTGNQTYVNNSYFSVGLCQNSETTCLGNPLNGYLNDVRFYDHALSITEIKELSRGLVCHYKLDSGYLENTTNLITTEDCLSATCYNGATRKYGYGTNTDMYKTVGVFQHKKCTKLYMGTSGNNARPYPYITHLYVSNGTNQPEYKTLSFDYYTTIGTYIHPYKLGSGSATCDWTNDKTTIKSGTFTNESNIPIVTDQWQHITMTLHGTTDANAEWGYIILGDTHVSDVNNYWLFANMQIETKDHATPYAGVGGTRNETSVIDSSGYGHHGQIWKYNEYGDVQISNETPRNSISTYINSEDTSTSTASGTVYIYGNCELTTPNYLTVAFWCKPFGGYADSVGQGQFCLTMNNIGSNAGSDYSTAPMHNRDSNIDMCTSTNVHKTVAINFTKDEWHHYAIVYDGRYGRIYKDGVSANSVDMGSNASLASMKAVVIGFSKAGGAWRSNKSIYSDFRIYTTALSANDILELYQIGAKIDYTGKMHSYELNEGDI